MNGPVTAAQAAEFMRALGEAHRIAFDRWYEGMKPATTQEEQQMSSDLLKTKVAEAAEKELGAIVKENINGIMKAYQESIEDHSLDAKFSFSIGMGLVLSLEGDGVKVRAKVGYGVKHTDETIGTVATTSPGLFDKQEQGKGKGKKTGKEGKKD